jgi:molybdopterin-guanine dinucleotide biosynthesis protein MobB
MPKKVNFDWLFHPFEFAFCGYSGHGKTKMISRIIENLSRRYTIGFVKHDVHGFELDREGKDTYIARKSGASAVLINDSSNYAEIHSQPLEEISRKIVLLDNDIVFIEGYKNSNVPKFVFLDPEDKILNEYRTYRWENVLGFIGTDDIPAGETAGHSYYCRDNLESIQDRILKALSDKINKIPLYGLVLAGGKSTRMQTEKSTLNYHGVNQAQFCYNLLSKTCQKVFISIREEQEDNPHFKKLPQIHDRFLDIGPLGGILTAMLLHPNAAWLVLGCDMPFVDESIISALVRERNPMKMATAFMHLPNDVPEPLCTIYEPKIRPILFQSLGLGYTFPLKALTSSEIRRDTLEDGYKIGNMNTMKDFRQALQTIQNGEHKQTQHSG